MENYVVFEQSKGNCSEDNFRIEDGFVLFGGLPVFKVSSVVGMVHYSEYSFYVLLEGGVPIIFKTDNTQEGQRLHRIFAKLVLSESKKECTPMRITSTDSFDMKDIKP
jgi:hypothetical protein